MRRQSLLISLCLLLLWVRLDAQTYGGYTLYSKMGSNKTYLIDINHSTYHTWTHNVQTGYSSYLLEGQVLLRTCQYNQNQLQGAAMTGMVQKVAWNGTVNWQYICSSSSYCAHHDIHPMPNGNVLMIVYEVKSPSEVTQAGCSQNITMWPDKIIEVQPEGSNSGIVVWEWHVWDHLIQDANPSKDNYGVVAEHPELIDINYNTQKDWMHTNGIDYNEELDQIVFSSHNLNEIYVIDHSTTTAQAAGHTGGNSGKGGDILYRWGNPAAYNLGTNSDKIFNVVHDAHWVPDGCPMADYLVGFNNKGLNNGQSCVDIISPPYNGYTYTWTSGSPYAPSSVTWRHDCNGNSQDQSSSQQFPNGNMMVCIASSGYIYEIDASQNLIWSFTAGGIVAKAYRYPACYVIPLTVTTTATPSTICSGASSQLNAEVPTGLTCAFSWTSDPPGFTATIQNPVVEPLVTTSYIVTVTADTCSVTDTVTVTVMDVPDAPVITQQGDSLVSGVTSGNQWYKDGSAIAGATGMYYVPSANGYYQVTATDANGCTSVLSNGITITNMGTGTLTNGQTLVVYPNPTTGKVQLQWNTLEKDHYEVSVYNAFGGLVSRQEAVILIDLSGMTPGVYFLVVTPEDSPAIRKKIVLINH